MKCSRFVQFLADEHLITPRYSYDALCTLSQPWLLHIPLVDFHGNNGSADYPSAPASFTEARLSRAGQAALAAERGTESLVPLQLINGDLHADGLAPPFSPKGVFDALFALLDNPNLSDEQIIERVGPPSSPTRCDAACELSVLAAGERTTLVWTANVRQQVVEQSTLFVVSNLPLSIGDDRVVETLSARVEMMHRDDPEWEPCDFDGDTWTPKGRSFLIPLKDVRNGSWGAGWGEQAKIVCEPLAGADLATCQREITSTWGVRIERPVQLAAPLPQLVRELVDTDSAAQRAALSKLAE
ncbi:MAG: hypothetical protein ACLPVY_00520 [Acidimicrobiia bacterium]